MSMSSLSSLSDHEDHHHRRQNNPREDQYAKYNDKAFKTRFRLNKNTIVYIVSLIKDNIEPSTKRSNSLTALEQLLITLRFYATGTYQRVIGDTFNVEQPTVHRVVKRVTVELARLKPLFIYMPDENERPQVANDFYVLAGFPRVLGALDCTHIQINSPGGPNSELYRNRKGHFSLNCQMICDAHLRVRHIIARWPGSVHDSTIFNDSPLSVQCEAGDYGIYHLLGDSGYPCRPYLLTPILRPNSEAEENYNKAQITTRNTVERMFGVMKKRFPCLKIGMNLKLNNVPPVIIACAVIYNICIQENDEVPSDSSDDESNNDSDDDGSDHEMALVTGGENTAIRTAIINSYFS